MRVIAGIAKGRILLGPKGDSIRPVLDKVKQAIFNILGDIEGACVLDLFAGTGSIGIEALSRGASQATFVDISREATILIRKNLERCSFADQAKVVQHEIPIKLARLAAGSFPRIPESELGSSGRPLSQPGQFDLIFVDPPYDQHLVNRTLKAIVREKLLAAQGTIVIEHSPREPIANDLSLKPINQRKYGQTLVSFLKQ